MAGWIFMYANPEISKAETAVIHYILTTAYLLSTPWRGWGEGEVSFSEKAQEYGLDNKGLSTHAAFFDYDNDGDLDCYLLD